MSKRWKIGVASLAVLAVGIQLVPVDRTNPPVEATIDAPREVMAVFRESCYDCHSHETVWPWYASIAPASWYLAWHVRDGRRHLNLSTWNRYDAERRDEKIEEIWEEVDDGAMPLRTYLWMHRAAVLTDADRATLRGWALGAGDAPPAGEEEEAGRGN